MRHLTLVLGVLALAACSQPTAEPADAPATDAPAVAAAPTQLGGVDLTQPLRVSGTEPFWTLDISGGVATWKDASDAIGDITTPRTGPAIPVQEGDAVVYDITLSDGMTLRLALTAGPCPDIGEVTRALNAVLTQGGAPQGQNTCADLRSAYPPESPVS